MPTLNNSFHSTENSSHNFNYLPLEFHQNFEETFGLSTLDFDTLVFDHHFVRWQLDEKYLGNLILHGNVRLWRNIAKSQYPLTKDLSHFQDAFSDIKRYFTHPDYTAEDLKEYNEKYSGIISYLIEKFPKTTILKSNIQDQVDQVLI